MALVFVIFGQYSSYGESPDATPHDGKSSGAEFSTKPPSESPIKSPQAFFDKGVEELKTGDPQKAVDFFTELIMVEPENPKAYKNRGVSLLKMGKIDLAIKDFEKALTLDPGLSGVHSNLGAAWYYKKEYQKAINSYDNEILKNPEAHISYFNRALSRIELNQRDLALADIQSCLEIEPGFQGALSLEKMLNGYEIQAGAFMNKKNGIKIKKLLEKKGLNPHILSLEDSRKRMWYFVRFEKFTDKKEADLYCKNFIKKEKIEVIVKPAGQF